MTYANTSVGTSIISLYFSRGYNLDLATFEEAGNMHVVNRDRAVFI